MAMLEDGLREYDTETLLAELERRRTEGQQDEPPYGWCDLCERARSHTDAIDGMCEACAEADAGLCRLEQSAMAVEYTAHARTRAKRAAAEIRALRASEARLLAALKNFNDFYPELAQLVNGFIDSDPVSWSEWDKSVQTRLRAMAERFRDVVMEVQ